jgi:hypothetical protein
MFGWIIEELNSAIFNLAMDGVQNITNTYKPLPLQILLHGYSCKSSQVKCNITIKWPGFWAVNPCYP